MNADHVSRRQALARTGVFLGATFTSGSVGTALGESSAGAAGSAHPFKLCFNTGTIRGQKLGLIKEIEITAQAGYQAIEPWVEAIEQYAKSGGSLREVKTRLGDLGLAVESAIGFPQWIVDDEAQRAKGLERARYEMELVAQIGGKRLAAPPAGATNTPGFDLLKAAERYRALLEVGDQTGVTPQLELWGFSQNLHLLAEVAFVAIQTGHPKACVLADMFHLYKGGSNLNGLKLLSKQALQVFHMNDYPSEPPREKINDGFRVFPGDGVAPLTQVLRDLAATGGPTVLSLELFSQKYWKQDAFEVAKTGLEKMKSVVKLALG